MQLPFSHLNLRFNPFGELNPEQRKQIAVVDIESIIRSLDLPSVAIQFLADHGRGKTTHLLALHKHYPDAEYTKIYTGDNPEFMSQAIRFVDSIENITKKQRRDLYKKSGSIAFTTHTDLSQELERAGFSVINKIISMKNEKTLLQIFRQRIEYARRAEGATPHIDLETVKQLKQRYGDDVRAMESFLYEKLQTLERIENVKM